MDFLESLRETLPVLYPRLVITLITMLTACIVDACTDLMAVLSRVCIAVERTCHPLQLLCLLLF